jgi:uncharacterized protein (DUF1501 family)
MNRRDFLNSVGAASVAALVPRLAVAGRNADYSNLFILVELKGGNDGLNTVIPYSASEYYSLRPRLAIPREQVLQLDAKTGLHPSLQPLLTMWEAGELAVVQGLGYPDANLSHFRSIEIWDTAANSGEYLAEGWLARAFAQSPPPRSFAADAIVVGGAGLGPMAGAGTRAIALTNTEQFVRQAKLAAPNVQARTGALRHILKVEADVVQAAARMAGEHAFQTEFPRTPFGNAVRTAAQVVATEARVAAIKLALNGFDTHSAQAGTQARLLKDLADGLVALKSALVETRRWQSSVVMTYSEFGRRPRENQSGGTDHGSSNAQFMVGGKVKGGIYGDAPALNRLDGNGNLAHAVDFRQLYATVLGRWWGADSAAALHGRYPTLDLIRV